MYYLQSRYYDPVICRFVNADALASTGYGSLGTNMFAYCNNNPITLKDTTGEYPVTQGIAGGLLALAALDGPLPIMDIIVGVGIVLHLYEEVCAKESLSSVSLDSIDWGSGDKKHILRGTRLRNKGHFHLDGWRRFGIDPENDNNWTLLLPILKETVDDADSAVHEMLKNGDHIILYTKNYLEQGVRVVVKIWVDASGEIQKLSDAIPYVLD